MWLVMLLFCWGLVTSRTKSFHGFHFCKVGYMGKKTTKRFFNGRERSNRVNLGCPGGANPRKHISEDPRHARASIETSINVYVLSAGNQCRKSAMQQKHFITCKWHHEVREKGTLSWMYLWYHSDIGTTFLILQHANVYPISYMITNCS